MADRADRWLRVKAASRDTLAAALFLLAACGGGGGGGGSTLPLPPPSGQNFTDPVVYSSAANASLQTAAEITSVTRHQLALNGVTLNYTATAGHLTARSLGTGTAQASFFYVAYALDNANAATRPVTFFYNGGPGSATVWLHLGSFGPKRLVTGAPSTTTATPFPLVDNAESMLDLSDLVFVDAIGSGYSQAIAPNVNSTFWGVDSDATAFRDFVMRYVTMNNRAASPKFLYGESYGGPRTGVLAHLLETAGMHLHGVVLQSPAMDYSSSCGILGDAATSCAPFLPTYSASGAWYNRANPSPAPAALPVFMTEMRTFAATQYDPAVRNLLVNGVQPPPALLTQLVNVTGLSLPNWQANFNYQAGPFQSALIPGTRIGRYDSRVLAPSNSALASGDPSSMFISPSFAAGITSHLAALGYTTPSNYVMLSNAISTWNFSHDGRQVPDTIPDLAAAIAINPALKVLSVSGYHDLATPFFLTEQDLARLGNNPNIRIRNYIGGHMTYLDDASRVLQKADLAQFYQNALAAQ